MITRMLIAALVATLMAQAKPNFVFFLVDDLGWADVGCYGSELHETPNIDRLAREGMRFTDAYAAAPVCSPTRASIMTGKYPARLHMTVWYESSANPPRGRKLLPPVTQGKLATHRVRHLAGDGATDLESSIERSKDRQEGTGDVERIERRMNSGHDA